MTDQLTDAARRFREWDTANAEAMTRGSYVRAYPTLIPDVFLLARAMVAERDRASDDAPPNDT